MKSRSEIWLSLLDEIGRECSVSTTQDRKTVLRRVRSEGESFFTITLPSFHQDVLTSMRLGWIPSDAFQGFRRRKVTDNHGIKHQGIPVFLGGFLDLIFTSETTINVGEGKEGNLIVPNPVLLPATHFVSGPRAVKAVKGLRQLLLLFSKEKNLSPPDRVEAAIQSYTDVDKHVADPLSIVAVTPSSKRVVPRLPEGSLGSFLGQLLAVLTAWFTMVSWFLDMGPGLLPIFGVAISSGLCLYGLIDLSIYSRTGNMLFPTRSSLGKTPMSRT
uniref:RNA-directed RNA polymerase n=1 Tax=Leviviridae sp. TaxID=2027243 RepID=A0A514D321_9VIRU|nr:MAG: hypothetical protein H3Rhizo37114_000003 [Leviviridae sp.]